MLLCRKPGLEDRLRTCDWYGPVNKGVDKIMVHRLLPFRQHPGYTVQINLIGNNGFYGSKYIRPYSGLYTKEAVLNKIREYVPQLIYRGIDIQLPTEMLTD